MSVRRGGCHCGDVRFEVEGEPGLVLRCNCSICSMRGGYLHWIVPREAFRLTTSWQALGHYSFGTHRAKRSKAIGATPLDDVPGVGATRKRALLAHFGSAKAVARANLADLKAVDGVSEKLAQTVYDFFHENG